MMNTNEKLEKFRIEMAKQGVDAVLIPSADPHQSEYVADHWLCRAWISGFTGSAGTVIITQDHAGLWTDSRYFLQAEAQLKNSKIQLHKLVIPHAPEHLQWLTETLAKGSTLGFDGRVVSQSSVESLENMLAGISLKKDVDIFTKVWKDRPDLPENKIFEIGIEYAGVSRKEKINTIQNYIKEKHGEYHLVVTLDDIAWTLNIRSNDVEFNPVSIAFLIIGLDAVFLYIDDKKVPAAIADNLNTDGIVCRPYDAIEEDLNSLSADAKVLVDPNVTSYALYRCISPANRINCPTIPIPLKARKNKTEVDNIRQAMRKDGVALTRLYRWLEQTLNERKVSEYEVSQKLNGFRASVGSYFGESFSAIVGYQGNGAIVHYRPDKEKSTMIEPKGILLLDSGGQYLEGTTDITRTTCFDEPSEEQKTNFTNVLKGHIALSSLHFPVGTRGNQMDVLARQFLWSNGLNYGHGTGHGVGYFLNVHEGPQGFGPGLTGKFATPFEEGMLTSNEPGFYKEGEYGIRIENLVLCVEDQETEFGKFLKFENLTLFPIDTKLIQYNLLTKDEVNWINDYHEHVFHEVSLLLDEDEKVWLKQKCRKI